MKHKVLILDDVPTAVTVVHDGEIYQALANQHPSFNLILERLNRNGQDTSVIALFDVQKALNNEFRRLSERVVLRGGKVLFDGDELHNGVTKQILRLVEENAVDRLNAFVKFTEKVMTNPQEHSRNQLFNWLDRYDFTITDDGDIVGYKGCASTAAGPASTRSAPESDGVTRNGKPVIDQPVVNLPGDVIEMPRSKVVWDPKQGCRNGLHVGTYAYAKSFASVLLEVHFNPRDVVSVPTDCGEQKIRTCRYTVVGPVSEQHKTAVLPKAQVETPVKEKDTEFTDDVIRKGDTVRLTHYIYDRFGNRHDPADNETFVVLDVRQWSTYKSLYLKVAGVTDSWAADRFEKVSSAKDVTKAQVWDTRNNHTKQKRYPKGHPKAGQFVPKV